jgi:arylsulfatase A-like enzyme
MLKGGFVFQGQRHGFLWGRMLTALCAGLFLIVGEPSGASASDRPPNVVLFLVDDMGWRDSSAYGSSYYETPQMERFAATALRFTDAYAVPLCSPTRASILTGQYSARHGVTSATGHLAPQPQDFAFLPETAPPNQPLLMPISRNYLPPEQYTLAEALRDQGYRTGHFGKWHLGVTPPHWPEQQGFDVAWHCEPSAGPPGAYFSPYGVLPPGTTRAEAKGKKYVVGTITDGADGEYITDRLTDEAVAFIEKNQDQPFFANIWHYGVHGPWGHKEAITQKFSAKADPSGRQGNPIMASMLASVDESLGRVLDTLDRLGLADNTLVIFYSDNGGNVHSNVPGAEKTDRAKRAGSPMLADWRKWAGDQPPTNNAPLREGKARIYEGGQRVPLMIRWPGKTKAGSTSDAVVGPIDLYPTVLECVGVEPSAEHVIDGESLVPVLTRVGGISRRAYFTWFPHLIPAVSVREGSWKLIRRFQPHPDYPEVRELYDLATDIGEAHNLAARMPEKMAHLDGLIDQFIDEIVAVAPRPNPAYQPPGPLDGLVLRSCTAEVTADSATFTATGRQPFLGTAAVKMPGPLKVMLTIRSRTGGQGRIQWKLTGQSDFPTAGQSVEYRIEPGDDWQTVQLDLPVEGVPAVFRIYLPAEQSPTEMQMISFSAGSKVRQWRFH